MLELFEIFESAGLASPTVTKLLNATPVWPVNFRVSTTVAPEAMEPSWQLVIPRYSLGGGAVSHVPWLELVRMKLLVDFCNAVRFTLFAVDGPALWTVMVSTV